MNYNSIDKFLAIQNLRQLAECLQLSAYSIKTLAAEPSYRTFSIPKNRGGSRTIEAPDKLLLLTQRRLNYYLQKVYNEQKPEYVTGFTAGSFGILENARFHIEKSYMLNMDLENFFPSISAKSVRDLFCSPPFSFNTNIATGLALLCTYKKCLPTGAATSPALSNLVFLPTDHLLNGWAISKGFTYSRFADDLTFSCNDPITYKDVEEIESLLKKSGFNINASKTRITRSSFRQVVTGIIVNEKPNVTRKYIRKLRAIIHDINLNGWTRASIKHNSHFPVHDAEMCLYRKVSGQLQFVRQVRGSSDGVYMKLNHQFVKLTKP